VESLIAAGLGYRSAVAPEPEQAAPSRGEIAKDISNKIVHLLKTHGDRGPTRCRTYFDDDLVIVLMRGGFSRVEDTLFEDGKFLDVRRMRHTFQDTMEARFTEVIEDLTGREVLAFMSASHQRPDLQLEVFVLDGASTRRRPAIARADGTASGGPGPRAAGHSGRSTPGWIRTSDFCLRRAALYPLSYGRLGKRPGV
jgi:uncharacterized protein YbcI